jgi:RNA polymerase sigma-70 factor (ECF subfamily)
VESIARDAAPVRQWLIAYFQRRIRNRDEIEDLVQEVFARIVSRNSSERIEHLGGYILKTAGSILADRARRRSTRHADSHIAFDPDQHGGADIDPERTLSDKEDLHVATAALLSLPERTRTIFVLRRLEGWRMNDIAAHLGISISAVEKHMLKAMRHLSAEMEKHRAA